MEYLVWAVILGAYFWWILRAPRYRITAGVTSQPRKHFYVRERLARFPFPFYGCEIVYSSDSRERCDQWIERANMEWADARSV